MCDNTQAETALHIQYEREDLPEIRSRLFDKHSLEPSYHDEISLRKKVTGLMVELKI
jgi:hypothetical protein